MRGTVPHMDVPVTRYAAVGEDRVAYQVVGEGPRDLVLVPPFISNIEVAWEHPPYGRFLRRLAEFSRVIVFDKRGTGLSDPVESTATFEQRVDEIGAVMDAAGCERATVLGVPKGSRCRSSTPQSSRAR